MASNFTPVTSYDDDLTDDPIRVWRGKKVLLLHSVDDGPTNRHISQIHCSPRLRDLEFRHCFVLECNPSTFSDESVRRMNSERQKLFFENHVVYEINKQYLRFNPDIFILHCGSAFALLISQYINMYSVLKEQFPNTRIALERVHRHFDSLIEKIRRTQLQSSGSARLARRVLCGEFDNDDEVEALIREIF